MMFRRKRAATVELDRRKHIRIEPPGVILVDFDQQQRTLDKAEVLNISVGGAALQAPVAVDIGERLSFSTGAGRPPVLAEVIACEQSLEGGYTIRCKCILGGFDL